MKTFIVSLILTTVTGVRRMEDAPLPPPPFVETGGFIAVVIVASVVLLCMLMCCCCTISNKKWIEAKRVELEFLTLVADTKLGLIEYKKWGSAPYMLMMPGTPGFAHTCVGFDTFGFGLITVSRPGYGRTPMTEERKKAEA